MIKTFEKYLEKITFKNFIGRKPKSKPSEQPTIDNFNLMFNVIDTLDLNGFARLAKDGMMMDFLEKETWCRIYLKDKTPIIRVCGTAYHDYKFNAFNTKIELLYYSEYKNGKIVEYYNVPEKLIIDCYYEDIIIDKLETKKERKNKDMFSELKIKINDIVKVYKDGHENIYRIIEIDKELPIYWGKVLPENKGRYRIEPISIIENLGKYAIKNPNPIMDPYGEEEWEM